MADNFTLDFIGIGAEKAATYWIAAVLREHPEVCFSKPKEIHFFDDKDPHLFAVKSFRYEWGIDWYKKHFVHCKNGIKGEFSPSYLYSKVSARRIKKHFPNVKIIVSLRNPVKRAFSQFTHDKSIGLIKDISYEKALKQYKNYFEKGLYYKHLAFYYSIFPAKNILVLLVSDIKKDSKCEVAKLYKFLDLKDVDFIPKSLNRKPNVASEGIFPALSYFLLQTEYFLRRRKCKFILKALEDGGLRSIARSSLFINRKPIKKYPKLNKKTEMRLRSAYISDISKLEKLLKRDLSFWKVLSP